MYRKEGDDDVVDFYDDLEFLKGLGMEPHAPIAYYWVLDEEMVQYWVPSDNISGYLHGGRYPTTELPLEEVCAALNARTKAVYTGWPADTDSTNQYSALKLRDDRDEYMKDHPCVLVKGGPLDGKCCIGSHCFPADIVDVLGLMVTDHIYHPDHDLWELTRETNTLHLWLSTYLVTDGEYTVEVDTSYSDEPQYTLVPKDRAYTDNIQVVCVGTLQECTDLMDHLGEVYAQGIAYVRSRVMEVCEE